MNSLDLTIEIRADEWALMQRRLKYLEALLIHILKSKANIKEWFSAAELEDMSLPDLPASRSAIGQIARKRNWKRREIVDKGRRKYVYHISDLPNRSFDCLLTYIMEKTEAQGEAASPFPLIVTPRRQVLPKNTAPVWVLPLMRLIKGDANGDLERAWNALPEHVPNGTILPDVDSAAQILIEWGIARK